MKRRTRRGKWYYILIVAAVALVAAFAHNAAPQDTAETGGTMDAADEGALRVHYIDVGQGDSELIELPNGEVMLIDAGENNKGELVAEYIKSQGIEKIDYLVGTHPHSDHIGGLDTVISEFEIGALYMPDVESTTKTFSDVLDAAEEKGLTLYTAGAGVSLIDTESLSVKFVAPVGTSYSSLNNYSAVVRVTYGNSSFLFTGDVESLAEDEITGDISADILKVGHHGSNTSSSEEFLLRVNPKCAVISCGEGNEYGHPHEETLEKLESIGAEVYRTDIDGTIVIETSGDGYTVYTENEG